MFIHVVANGETLLSISRYYGVEFERVAADNGLRPPYLLAVGQDIIIRVPRVQYTVQSGDTLYFIANRFGVTVDCLYRNNLFLNAQPDLMPGMVLVIEYENSPDFTYEVGGYTYPFIEEQLLDITMPFINLLIPFTYGFNDDGTLVTLDDSMLLNTTFRYNRRAFMHLSTLNSDGVFSTQAAMTLLNSRPTWDVLYENVLENIKEKGYSGLDIDFEFLGAENAKKYAEFVGFMTNLLNKEGYPVITALSPKVRDDQPGLLYEGHNYKAIGLASDYVLLMTYEWGYTYGPPMAVSPINQVRRVLDYAQSRLDMSKAYLGISNYGYDWKLPFVRGETKATSLSTAQAYDLAIRNNAEIEYDYRVQAPFFYYSDGGSAHVVWFENARALKARLSLINEYGMKGGLYWNLTRENRQGLMLLSRCLNE